MPAPNPYIPGDNSFGLVPRMWYAWTVIPGYMDYPYQSAILLHKCKPVPTRKTFLEIVYREAGYADGVQEFERRVKVLAWTRHAVVCMFDREDGGHRVATISELHADWLRKIWPDSTRTLSSSEDVQVFMNKATEER